MTCGIEKGNMRIKFAEMGVNQAAMKKSVSKNEMAPRFGIGEWYGQSFLRLDRTKRRRLAEIAMGPDHPIEMQCPFLSRPDKPRRCWKKGGVCSLRLYKQTGHGSSAEAVSGQEGDLRVVCPSRFDQAETIYHSVGSALVGTSQPRIVKEVRFLQRPQPIGTGQMGNNPVAEESDEARSGVREDVGNIDCVLVHPDVPPMRWCALEIQAVYFSGEKMRLLFEHIRNFAGSGLPFPDRVRRPDYRSSGPKRLMPQLQIKVPTLRRWGKKMAVVVDAAFFRNLGSMRTVSDLSNADIAWFVASFDETRDPIRLMMGSPYNVTLEGAVEGLTGGQPVSLMEFEAKITEKLGNDGEVTARRGGAESATGPIQVLPDE